MAGLIGYKMVSTADCGGEWFNWRELCRLSSWNKAFHSPNAKKQSLVTLFYSTKYKSK